MASAVDDAGFEIRDMFAWLYTQNQVKAMSLNHFVRRMNISDADKAEIEARLEGWKTPQIKTCIRIMYSTPRGRSALAASFGCAMWAKMTA